MVHLGDQPDREPAPSAAPLTRRQITDALVRGFDITQQFDTIRVLFKRFGITPLVYGVDPISGRGHVGFYDPLVVWVLATYFSWPRLCRIACSPQYEELTGKPPADVALHLALEEARERRGGVDDEATRRYAYYWFISRREWGVDIRTLDAAIERHPEVLTMTLDSPSILEEVLRLYKRDVIEWSLGRAVRDIDRVELRPQFVTRKYPDPDTGAVQLGTLPPQSDEPDFEQTMRIAGLYDPAKDRRILPVK